MGDETALPAIGAALDDGKPCQLMTMKIGSAIIVKEMYASTDLGKPSGFYVAVEGEEVGEVPAGFVFENSKMADDFLRVLFAARLGIWE